MKLFNFFFFIIFVSLLSINNLKAENKVAYLDIDFILNNTLAGKSLLNNLKKEEQLKIDKFKETDENFKNEESKILAKKNLISKEEVKKEMKALQVNFKEYRKSKNKEIENLKKKEIEI